jgi:hypothetical protein
MRYMRQDVKLIKCNDFIKTNNEYEEAQIRCELSDVRFRGTKAAERCLNELIAEYDYTTSSSVHTYYSNANRIKMQLSNPVKW